jgi:tight adherence protein B
MIVNLVAVIMLATGVAIGIVGLLVTLRRREEALAEILDLPFGDLDVPVTAVTENETALFQGTLAATNRLLNSLDQRGSLSALLERARIPVRPAEYVLLTAAGGAVMGMFLVLLTGEWLFALRRIRQRRSKFEEALPDALSLIAGSLAAGHTFLRAIQMMCEEAEPPMSEEFARVVQETRLGDSLVDGLARMAERLDMRDLDWVVQAVRIQNTVGGKLSDLLYTLADFMRAREEVRREVKVLTAEGRISAWVLGALPPVVLLAVQVSNPSYMKPMFHGTGLFVLGGLVVSICVGVAMIFRMVQIEV